jgi:hypothetical protein
MKNWRGTTGKSNLSCDFTSIIKLDGAQEFSSPEQYSPSYCPAYPSTAQPGCVQLHAFYSKIYFDDLKSSLPFAVAGQGAGFCRSSFWAALYTIAGIFEVA